MERLARIISRIRRALALLIVGWIVGAIIGELVARVAARIREVEESFGYIEDVGSWFGAGMPPPGPPSRRPDWHAARRTATEAEYFSLHPIDLTETHGARPAGPAV